MYPCIVEYFYTLLDDISIHVAYINFMYRFLRMLKYVSVFFFA
jgi:hypothetical protein